MIKLENKTWGVMAGMTQKSWGALFPLRSLQKNKNEKKQTNWMGILISKNIIIKVFILIMIIKTIIMTRANNDSNNNYNNNSSNNSNNLLGIAKSVHIMKYLISCFNLFISMLWHSSVDTPLIFKNWSKTSLKAEIGLLHYQEEYSSTE